MNTMGLHRSGYRALPWLLALCAGGTARADFDPYRGYVELPQILAPMILGNQANENLRLINKHYANGGKASAAGKSPSVTLAPAAAKPSGPRLLAARYPTEQRPQIERAFAQSLSTYQQLEAKLAIPKGDVAGAVSAFLAGNYMAYHDKTVPDPDFKRLVEQMRGVLGSSAPFNRSSPTQKREMYEQWAIVGTFMATGREEIKRGSTGMDAAAQGRFRQAAKANLESFLQTTVDRIHLGERGLALR